MLTTPHRMLASLALALSLTAASTTALAEGKKDLVAKVLQLQQPGLEGLGNSVASNTANQVMQVVGRSLGKVPEAKREALAKDIQADVRKFYEDVSAQLRDKAIKLAPSTVGTVYEEKFTEDELKTLITWLESPVNKKFQQVAVDMQQAMGQKLIAETRAMVEPKLKALEQTIGKKIDTAAGASGDGAKAPAKK